MLLRLIRVLMGYLAGSVFAIAATSAVLMALEPGYVPRLEDVTMVAWFVVLFGWTGIPIGIIAESAGYRSPAFFLIAGFLAAGFSVLTLIVWGGLDVWRSEGLPAFLNQIIPAISGSIPVLLFATPAGLAAGFGYWLAAGRFSGT